MIHDRQWGGYEVRQTKRGYLVSTWSRIQGSKTDGKWLVYFSTQFPKGVVLVDDDVPYSAMERLIDFARWSGPLDKDVRCLRKPFVLQ